MANRYSYLSQINMDLITLALHLMSMIYMFSVLAWLLLKLQGLTTFQRDVVTVISVCIVLILGDVLGRVYHVYIPFIFSMLVAYAFLGLVWLMVRLCKRNQSTSAAVDELLVEFEIGDV